jgi:cytidylyltransferase family
MLRHRVITALLLLFFTLAVAFVGDYRTWLIFTGVIVVLVQREYAQMSQLSSFHSWLYIFATLILAWGVIQNGFKADGHLKTAWLWGLSILSLGLWTVCVPFLLKHKIRIIKYPLLSVLVGQAMVVPFAVYFAHLFWLKRSFFWQDLWRLDWIILYLLLLVFWADIVAYFVGKAFGKHKLAPVISPGKSIEGAVGALILVMAYSALYYFLFRGPLLGSEWSVSRVLHDNIHWKTFLCWVIFSIVLTVMSIVGDLWESWLKRCVGIKDSGRILPGHGGIYDRIDSWVAVLSMYPVINLLLLFTT